MTLVYIAVFHGLPLAEKRPVQWLGRLSYSLYLVHAYPGYITMKIMLDHGWNRDLAIVIVIAQSFVLAIILHKLVEIPVTTWLRNRKQSRRRQLSSATPS